MALLRLRVIESNGKEHQVIWAPGSGIGGLEKAVWLKTGVPQLCQKLFIRGDQMVCPLEMFHIDDGDTLQLVEDKSAGMWAYHLGYAAEHSDQEADKLVRYLIESGDEDVNARIGWDRSTALHKAARWKSRRRGVREDLIGVGANCDSVTSDRRTPLHEAVFIVHWANPLAAFLCGGANPNVITKYGDTPLMDAAWRQTPDAVCEENCEACFALCELIESGAALDVTNSKDQNALYKAAQFSEGQSALALENISSLLSVGADPNVRFQDFDEVRFSVLELLNMGGRTQRHNPHILIMQQ